MADIGVIGLSTMGGNLALNIERNKFKVAVYNRTYSRTENFMKQNGDKNIVSSEKLEGFVNLLSKPRKIIIMVVAGKPVDSVIEQLLNYLEKGDLIMDCGNSFFEDTERRAIMLEEKGIKFMGVGVSGGEEGALNGPSIMPGGSPEAWNDVKHILELISAKADDGRPCVDYIGPRGAGHYVKSVHNAIEYADMQLIAEAYDILRKVLKLQPQKIAQIFEDWNKGELDSYLIEITSKIFKKIDDKTQKPLVDIVLDKAAQKGTGKWTSQNALNLGAPIPAINSAVVERVISSMKEKRVIASKKLFSGVDEEKAKYSGSPEELIESVRKALYASKINAYAQGMELLLIASEEYKYNLNLGSIASLWRSGCIIRAKFLNLITQAYEEDPKLTNLLLYPYFTNKLKDNLADWRKVIQIAVGLGIPVPAFSSSLAYYDSYRSEFLPANLIQAQRDFFGAHTFKRLDADLNENFHAHWEDK
ncbi:6-phosphogluconate dehydrogenase decarboxylating [Anaeramoeba ignava]|uniref:6-phosphogluconate dehydrogenase, decarboxylating n=1 Tax=Anaeramoeba ignava TaxID=1746090 RepID=A0A9Q0LHT6_ANAIG|nr:6-phosphogluconate dehydrogenase decarboxylating [Anaeramoeba ignava]|eukprot:Anaeramoba_ignava/a218305_340.p1 GENE.a218305_340~~a218305_340.p1  ORF type:complete len:475 (+),score=135.13 a218305_340:15-1439(+)